MKHLGLHGAVVVHAAADERVSYALLHGNTLSRQHGLIHGGGALHDHRVQRDAAAGLHENVLALPHQPGLNLPFRTVLQNNRSVRSQLHELPDGLGGLSLAAALHIFSQHHQRHHHGGGLIV